MWFEHFTGEMLPKRIQLQLLKLCSREDIALMSDVHRMKAWGVILFAEKYFGY